MLYAHSVGYGGAGLARGTNAGFKSGGLRLLGGDRQTRWELRAQSVDRAVDASVFEPPFEVRRFPGYAPPECPLSPDAGLSAQFSEACVRSLVVLQFVWPHLLDDYLEPLIAIDSTDSFRATYYPRLTRVHGVLEFQVSRRDPRPDTSFYDNVSTRAFGLATVTFRDSGLRALPEHGPPKREAVWSDDSADYTLATDGAASESADAALQRVLVLILGPAH